MLIVFIILWTIIGAFFGYYMADNNLFGKLNNKATLLAGICLGPLTFIICVIGLGLEYLDKLSKTHKFQKQFFKPQYIVPEERKVDRNIVVVDED